jgi:hypothetical protein
METTQELMKKLHLSLESSTNFFRNPNRATPSQAAALENACKAINPVKTQKNPRKSSNYRQSWTLSVLAENDKTT